MRKMKFKWMKEHKKERNIVIAVGIIEICAWIIVFICFFRKNNWLINSNNSMQQYGCGETLSDKIFSEMNIISVIITIITGFFGGPIIFMIKRFVQQMGKIDKDKYSVVGKIRDTDENYKLWLLSFLQFFIGILGWLLPSGVFYIVTFGMEQILQYKNQIVVPDVNLIALGSVFSGVIVFCMIYIITKKYLCGIIALLIYCLCALLLILGICAKDIIKVYFIITIISILLSLVLLHMLHKINLLEEESSLRMYIFTITKDIIVSAFLFGIVFLQMQHIYDVTYWMYITVLVLDFGVLHDKRNLKDVYIEIENDNRIIRTKGDIIKIGDMVMYTTTDGIKEMINYKFIKKIRYSYKISKKYRIMKKCRSKIYAELKNCRIFAGDYKIKKEWIFFCDIYNEEKRINIYKMPDFEKCQIKL